VGAQPWFLTRTDRIDIANMAKIANIAKIVETLKKEFGILPRSIQPRPAVIVSSLGMLAMSAMLAM